MTIKIEGINYADWFEDLLMSADKMKQRLGSSHMYNQQEAQFWIVEAHTAINYIFPNDSPVMVHWEKMCEGFDSSAISNYEFERLVGIIQAARKIFTSGRLI